MSNQVVILSERSGPSTDHELIDTSASLILSPASKDVPVGGVCWDGDECLVLDLHELDATTGRTRDVDSIVGMR